MNFDKKLDTLKTEMDNLILAYVDARNFTEGFLECCKKYGIKTVSIQERTDLIPYSKNFGFGAEGSVFAEEKIGDWPAIWTVAQEYGIGAGCGNACQYQITRSAAARLIDGVYQLKNGNWRKV